MNKVSIHYLTISPHPNPLPPRGEGIERQKNMRVR